MKKCSSSTFPTSSTSLLKIGTREQEMDLQVIELHELSLPLLKKLVVLEREAFGPGGLDEWTLPVFVRFGRVFLLKKAEEICGVAEFLKDWSRPELAFLVGFSVKKKFRKGGLGKYFLEEILNRLGSQGISRVQLTVSPENIHARRLYEKFGFYEVGYSADEYGLGEDRMLLELNLRGLKDGRV